MTPHFCHIDKLTMTTLTRLPYQVPLTLDSLVREMHPDIALNNRRIDEYNEYDHPVERTEALKLALDVSKELEATTVGQILIENGLFKSVRWLTDSLQLAMTTAEYPFTLMTRAQLEASPLLTWISPGGALLKSNQGSNQRFDIADVGINQGTPIVKKKIILVIHGQRWSVEYNFRHLILAYYRQFPTGPGQVASHLCDLSWCLIADPNHPGGPHVKWESSWVNEKHRKCHRNGDRSTCTCRSQNPCLFGVHPLENRRWRKVDGVWVEI